MKPKISLITLGVEDLARSRAFYVEGLGLPVAQEHPGIVFLQTAGTMLALFGRDALAADAGVSAEGTGFRGFSLAHNVTSREAVGATLGQAVAAGATLIRPARATDWGGYSGYFADPDGFLWEVAHNPFMDLT